MNKIAGQIGQGRAGQGRVGQGRVGKGKLSTFPEPLLSAPVPSEDWPLIRTRPLKYAHTHIYVYIN